MKKMILLTILCIVMQLVFYSHSAAEEIDYTIYNNLLKKYVADEAVDYLTWKKDDFVLFEGYIESLENVSLDNLSQNQRKAFWINAYNAITIYAVLKHIPNNKLLARAFSVQMVSGFFDKKSYRVAAQTLTLNDIENKKLRSEFGDPRIHFAIVCASRSCPGIEASVFRPRRLEKRLDKATVEFMQDETRNRLDKKKNILYLSQIFNWYEVDFTDDSGSVINYVKRYLNPADTEHLSSQEVKIKYLYYNWLVNIER